jgi:hypothetical protein
MEVSKVGRVKELLAQKEEIEQELAAIRQQAKEELLALKGSKKERQPRKKKQGDLALVKA